MYTGRMVPNWKKGGTRVGGATSICLAGFSSSFDWVQLLVDTEIIAGTYVGTF